MSGLVAGTLSPLGDGVAISRNSRGGFAWFHLGWAALFAACALSLIGILAIDTTEAAFAKKQAVFGVVGVMVAVLICLPNIKRVTRCVWPLYFISLALLLFVMIPGVPEWLVRPKNGARRWISLGLFEFQPSEIAKLAVVMALALWMRAGSELRRLGGFAMPFVLAAPPMMLILIEPDLGTALMLAPAVVAMVLAAGARKRHVVYLIVAVVAIAPLSYPLLKSHQRERVDALFAQLKGDHRYERDIGFQADRAITLIGSGGFAGVGKDRARALVIHNRLPEQHNDMIFAVICCRWGFLGGVLTWGFGMLFAFSALLIALLARDSFSRLVCIGIAATFTAQLLINTGMNVGVLPVTGVTLPFISYGGSSLVALWISTGLLFNLARRRPRGIERLEPIA